MKHRFILFSIVAVSLTIPQYATAQVDCSLLDPRHSISKEKEGKITGSVETLYRIAKAGGNIEGRLHEEIINLEGTASASEKSIIRLRAIYLFCGMIANSADIPIDKKVSLFSQMLGTVDRSYDSQFSTKSSPQTKLSTASGTDQTKTSNPAQDIGRPQRNILFEDTFDKQHRWPAAQFVNSGRTSYQDGWYVLQNTTESLAFFMRLNEAGYFPASVRIEVDVRLNAGPLDKPYGLLLGATDGQFKNAYSVLLRGDGATEVVRWIDNTNSLEMYLPANPAVRAGYGAVNKLAVEIQDDGLVYFINGTQIGRYRASTRIQGYIGLYTDYPGLDVGFNNLRISQ